jgi:hypothetical protein
MSYLRYLCLLAHSGVQLNPYCVFCLSSSVYHILPVSLDCPLLINGRHKTELKTERDIHSFKDKKHGSLQNKIYTLKEFLSSF